MAHCDLTGEDWWSIALAIAAVAAFLFAFGYERDMPLWMGVGFLLIFSIIYVPLTYVALRSAKLNGALRYVFCLTAAPVYAVLFVASMIWLFDAFPVLEKQVVKALEGGGRRAGMPQGFLSAVVAAIVFWLWYRLCRLLDGVINRGAVDGEAG